MGELVVRYDTLSLSQQVIERQEGHARRIASYLPHHADIAVTAEPSGAGTRLTVAVEKGGEHRAGRRRGREALTAAFQDAQRRGIMVTTTPWEKP